MNPLTFWQNMTTKGRMTLIIVLGVVVVTLIVCATISGNFNLLPWIGKKS